MYIDTHKKDRRKPATVLLYPGSEKHALLEPLHRFLDEREGQGDV